MLSEDHESLSLLARELVFPIEEIADSCHISTTDSSTYLVELCEPELLRV